MRRFAATTACALLLSAAFAFPAPAADWTQFRGPGGSGLTDESDLPTSWSESENVKWTVDVPGMGWACPIVVDGRVIIATAISDGEKNKDSDTRWELHCFDADTGDVLWTKLAAEGKPRIGTHGDNTYASETPATDGERILAYFGMTGVYCYDLDGNLLWDKDLGAYPMRNDWGTASSPVLLDGLAYIQVDNEQESFLVALDAATGDEKWRKTRDETSNWGSLVVWENSKRTELVAIGETVRSYDPANGEVLWEVRLSGGGANSSPATAGDLLVVGNSGRRDPGALVAVRAGGSGDLSAEGNDGLLWRVDGSGPSRSSPLIYEGYVYLLGGRGGIVSCLNAETGEPAYRERMPSGGSFWASPYAYEGRIFCPADNGVTYVLKPGPEFELLATNKLEGRFWSTPAIANGALFIRSVDKLYCVGK